MLPFLPPPPKKISPDFLIWVMGILRVLRPVPTAMLPSVTDFMSLRQSFQQLGACMGLVLLGTHNQPRPEHVVSVKVCCMNGTSYPAHIHPSKPSSNASSQKLSLLPTPIFPHSLMSDSKACSILLSYSTCHIYLCEQLNMASPPLHGSRDLLQGQAQAALRLCPQGLVQKRAQ